MNDLNKKYLVKNKRSVQVCTQCIYDEDIPEINFDNKGVCNYCYILEDIKKKNYFGTEKAKLNLDKIIFQAKVKGKGKKYDAVVGVSGGVDSSYLLYYLQKRGLRLLAVHYDNTWNSNISTMNIRNLLKSLNIDLYTHVINNKEADDIFKSFFIAGVPEIEASTDLALSEVLHRAASKYKVKYIFEGHSLSTESITPLGKNYFDGRYIKEIHKRYGCMEMKTYPLMTLSRFLYWKIVKRIKFIRPFLYIEHSKETAREFLEKKFEWKYYGGHHLENKMTQFYHQVYNPKKFNLDLRCNSLSSLVRNKNISRLNAWKEFIEEKPDTKEIEYYFCKRMGFNKKFYKSKMKENPRYWKEFPTYKKIFEILSPLFYILLKLQLVPESFYIKYCKNK